MKTALILFALIVMVGLGYYRGWFQLSARNDSGKPDVTISVDKDKMAADKDRVVGKVQELGHEARAQVGAATRKAQN